MLLRNCLWRIGALAAVMSCCFQPANADQVINDDLIVTGSSCVGFDCVNGESFGFDTTRLKENNLRLHFDDTSNSASFPNNDWRIVANDTSNGGGNYLAIEDATASRQVFRVDAGAPANSLRVNSSGSVGIGTASPVVNVHVATGNTPTLRLEQNGSAGFTSQTWDVAGNEANFFVRDVTNGSKLPFRITPNTPTSAIRMFASRIAINDGSENYDTQIKGDNENNLLFVDASADRIGIGTDAPAQLFHVSSGSNTTALIASTAASSFPQMRLQSPGAAYSFAIGGSTNEFRVTNINSGANPLRIASGSNNTAIFVGSTGKIGLGTSTIAGGDDLTHVNGAHLTTAGVWADASSRELKQDINTLGAEEASQALDELNPVKYRYKRAPEEQYVGFIAEDVPDLVALGDRKSLAPMDIVAVLTKAVKEQKRTVQQQQQTIEELSSRIEQLESKRLQD